jgi:hypothetical protein
MDHILVLFLLLMIVGEEGCKRAAGVRVRGWKKVLSELRKIVTSLTPEALSSLSLFLTTCSIS